MTAMMSTWFNLARMASHLTSKKRNFDGGSSHIRAAFANRIEASNRARGAWQWSEHSCRAVPRGKSCTGSEL